jgi:hypothetical protein
MRSVRVAGLGGSLRDLSTSRTALQVALEGAATSGADVELIWVRDLGLDSGWHFRSGSLVVNAGQPAP